MRIRRPLLLLMLLACLTREAMAQSYTFGVLPQRSATLTAQYWNPILEYASRKTGVQLVFKTTRSGQESRDAAKNGEYDFIFSNHIFQPAVADAGYQVILRPRELSIFGQIVVPEDSPVKRLEDLNGLSVGFPSPAAFIAYSVPMDHLVRNNITVAPVFGGNQEGIMAQLKAGRVAAAGVNQQVMREYGHREGARYRVLWSSPSFFNIPVAAHPRVPAKVVVAVRKAIDEMEDTEEGRRILADSAAVIGQSPPYGFLLATNADYRNYTDFYRQTVLKEFRK